MSRPVMDNFIPFAVENLTAIRELRYLELSRTEPPVKKGRKTQAKGPRLDARAKQVVAGLDSETQRILAKLMGKT